jgi:5-methylcytosine-specific restriction endonuclease McrA
LPSRPEIASMRKTYKYQQARLVALKRDRYVCWLCGRPGADTADHVVPLAKGGHPYDVGNLRAAHRRCNSSRQASTPTLTEVSTSRRW